MRLPFPDWILVTPIKVYVEIPGEDGVTEELIFDGKCNFSEKSRTILNERKQVVELTGKAVFKGDIYPGKLIRGYVEVDGTKRTINRSRKPRNPDGSIYSTELDLM
ncbi:hypothetical protein GOQ29_05025 [Clostridium sp. D2Q-14]|uniref:hypothetical protein n=1 Tax=Anaeromonas gelatinilytica TaxID=2683194 RepID=UPI00193C5CAE|nr:hypothetical protein [Anaeromonas gelatinilytica]MBS4534979.1 hypothetical protein [Anaeromonas gelatinilytica]